MLYCFRNEFLCSMVLWVEDAEELRRVIEWLRTCYPVMKNMSKGRWEWVATSWGIGLWVRAAGSVTFYLTYIFLYENRSPCLGWHMISSSRDSSPLRLDSPRIRRQVKASFDGSYRIYFLCCTPCRRRCHRRVSLLLASRLALSPWYQGWVMCTVHFVRWFLLRG